MVFRVTGSMAQPKLSDCGAPGMLGAGQYFSMAAVTGLAGPFFAMSAAIVAGSGTQASVTVPRSEEHTSELQSLRHLVCRLLLDTATTEIYTLSLHDALPISVTGLAGPFFAMSAAIVAGSGTQASVTVP